MAKSLTLITRPHKKQQCFTGHLYTKCRKCLVTLLSNNGVDHVLVWQNITFNCRRVAGTLINLSSHHVCPRERGRGLTSHKTKGRRKCHTYSAIPSRALTRTNTMWINTLVSYLYLASLSIWHNLKKYSFKKSMVQCAETSKNDLTRTQISSIILSSTS